MKKLEKASHGVLGERWLVETDGRRCFLDEVRSQPELARNLQRLARYELPAGLAGPRRPEVEADLCRHLVELPEGCSSLAHRAWPGSPWELGWRVLRLVRQAHRAGLCGLTLALESVYHDDDEVWLSDFWWAVPLGEPALTLPEHARALAAPEALAGTPVRESDYFSLGALLKQLTSEHPQLLAAATEPEPGRRISPARLEALLGGLAGIEFDPLSGQPVTKV